MSGWTAVYFASLCPMNAGYVRTMDFFVQERGKERVPMPQALRPLSCGRRSAPSFVEGKSGPVNSAQNELFSRYGPGPFDKGAEFEVWALPSVQGRSIDYYPVSRCCQPADGIRRKPFSPCVAQDYEVPVILQKGCKVEHIKWGPATVISLRTHSAAP